MKDKQANIEQLKLILDSIDLERSKEKVSRLNSKLDRLTKVELIYEELINPESLVNTAQ